MTAAWMTSTLSAPTEGGGYSLLPAGINNFTIANAEIVVNQWNGRNEVVLTLNSPIGGGKTEIPLEPWDAAKLDTFLKVFNNGLGNIGVPVEGMTAQAVLASLPKTLPAVIGNVIECNVIHEDRKAKPDGSHLKNDGTPWQNAKCYINRLVSTGTAKPASTSDFQPVVAAGFAANDDIPF